MAKETTIPRKMHKCNCRPTKEMIDYNNQTIRIGSATLESAFNGDRGIELGTLIAYSMLVKSMNLC